MVACRSKDVLQIGIADRRRLTTRFAQIRGILQTTASVFSPGPATIAVIPKPAHVRRSPNETLGRPREKHDQGR